VFIINPITHELSQYFQEPELKLAGMNSFWRNAIKDELWWDEQKMISFRIRRGYWSRYGYDVLGLTTV